MSTSMARTAGTQRFAMAAAEPAGVGPFLLARTQERVQYTDVASAMFDAQGQLPADLFVEDGLHPTRKCYALWTSIIKPVLLQQKVAAPASAGR